MKDPTRLLDLSAADPARELLRAAALEEPPQGALERLLAVLPVPPAAAAPAADRHPSGVRPALRAGASGVRLGSRWLSIAGGAGSLGAAIWIAVRLLAPPSAAVEQPTAAPSAAPPPVITAAERPAAPPPPAAAPERGTVAESGARPRSLAQEIASLDHVRKLLGEGDPAAALRALRRHARSHPQGALLQEAELLQIEALTRAGEPARARVRAAQFLAQHPDSPHAARVRSLLAGADGAP